MNNKWRIEQKSKPKIKIVDSTGSVFDWRREELVSLDIPSWLKKEIRRISQDGELHIVVFPDLHFPWCNAQAVEKALKYLSEWQPNVVIQLGDFYDFYCWSKYRKTFNLITPKEELRRGTTMGREFWKRVRQSVPKAKLYQLFGNHEERYLASAQTLAPQLEEATGLHMTQLLSFPGVEVIPGHNSILLLNENIAFIHGYSNRIGVHMNRIGASVVHGHTHYARQDSTGNIFKKLWELDCGWLGDSSSLAFMFRPLPIDEWTLGVGRIWTDKDGIIQKYVHEL